MATDLEKRFFDFKGHYPGAESVDRLLPDTSRQIEHADYLLHRRSVIVEVKSLTVDVSEHVHKVLKQHEHRPEYPLFFGSVDVEHILRRLPDGDRVRRAIFNRVTRSLEGAIRKSHQQIAATKQSFNLSNAWGLLVILNEAVDVLAPNVISKKLFEKDREWQSSLSRDMIGFARGRLLGFHTAETG